MGLLLGATACGEKKRQRMGPRWIRRPAGGAAVTVANSAEYGSYLADAHGRALYLFTADKPGRVPARAPAPRPPYLASQGAPTAGSDSVQTPMLGTLKRPDGAVQVVYNQHPLYSFQKDTGPGQTMGQDVHGFGGEWYLVTPQGEKLEKGEGGEQS